jgi:hypothetical protein
VGCGGLSQSEPVSEIESLNEDRHVPVSVQFVPSGFGVQQGGSDPAKALIEVVKSHHLLVRKASEIIATCLFQRSSAC